mmetsp:Transcript_24291/g.65864  ORF Transcript_24291/g.65864 Transcript_24291/m.65864 type:complete len:395 (-) Transcript_24291:1931-3115(-)
MPKVHHVVHRKANDDGGRDGLCNAESPAHDGLAKAKRGAHNERNGEDGKGRDCGGARGHHQHNECDGKADGEAREHAVHEGLLCHNPREVSSSVYEWLAAQLGALLPEVLVDLVERFVNRVIVGEGDTVWLEAEHGGCEGHLHILELVVEEAEGRLRLIVAAACFCKLLELVQELIACGAVLVAVILALNCGIPVVSEPVVKLLDEAVEAVGLHELAKATDACGDIARRLAHALADGLERLVCRRGGDVKVLVKDSGAAVVPRLPPHKLVSGNPLDAEYNGHLRVLVVRAREKSVRVEVLEAREHVVSRKPLLLLCGRLQLRGEVHTRGSKAHECEDERDGEGLQARVALGGPVDGGSIVLAEKPFEGSKLLVGLGEGHALAVARGRWRGGLGI